MTRTALLALCCVLAGCTSTSSGGVPPTLDAYAKNALEVSAY